MKHFVTIPVLLVVFVVPPACAPTQVRDTGPAPKRTDVERLVKTFLYWSDLGLYGTAEWKKGSDTDQRLAYDVLADGRELEKLLSPSLKVVIKSEGKRFVLSRFEFVNFINRNRFMRTPREGLLDDPDYTVRGARILVRMRTFSTHPNGGVPATCDSVLTVALDDDASPMITKIERGYAKATDEEVKRIPQLPGFAHPPGGGGPRVVRSMEDFKKSMEAMRPRPATKAEIRAWIDKLEDTGRKGSSRALAAYFLGTTGPAAREAIPALIAALKDWRPVLRKSAANALGNMGAEAASATPFLREVLDDESSDVRFEAEWALERIQASR